MLITASTIVRFETNETSYYLKVEMKYQQSNSVLSKT